MQCNGDREGKTDQKGRSRRTPPRASRPRYRYRNVVTSSPPWRRSPSPAATAGRAAPRSPTDLQGAAVVVLLGGPDQRVVRSLALGGRKGIALADGDLLAAVGGLPDAGLGGFLPGVRTVRPDG